MSPVFVIARNVVREALRRRILYVVILFCAALMLMVESVSRVEAQVQVKMVKDFSYAIVSFFGLILVILTTFEQVPNEIESRTIYLVLSRPVARQHFLLGKYVGILAVLSLVMSIIGGLFMVLAGLAPGKGIPFDMQVAQALYLLYLKYACFAALLMLFTVLMSRPLAVTLSILVYFYGHVLDFLNASSDQPDSALSLILKATDFVLPNFSVLEFPSHLVRPELFTAQSLLILTVYSLSFAALYLTIATWALATKEL